MRRYETICIVRPGAGEEKINAIVGKTTDVIKEFGGEPVAVDHWGTKKLAYLIQKETQGYYVFIEYAGMPEAVKEIERLFRINDQVLKYMTVKTQDTFVPTPPKEKVEETAEAEVEEEAEA